MRNNKSEPKRRKIMKYLRYLALTLVLIGALNWGLVGFFKFDLIAYLFGDMSLMSRILYALVGISAIIASGSIYHCKINETENCRYNVYNE